MNDTIDLELNLPVIKGTLTACFELDEDLLWEDFKKEFPQHANERWMIWMLEDYKEFKNNSARKYYKPDWYIIYCTLLRQNGFVESILSKKRIQINEKTTMDF